MGTFQQDVYFGLRTLAKSPSFAAIAIITLALGIGANTAIFSVINAVLLRPLPFRDPGRLVQLWQTEPAPGEYPLTGADYLDWQAQNQTLEGTSVLGWPRGFNVSGAGEPEQAAVIETQANFFSLLGVEPLLGRTFLKGEDQSGQNHVAVLSYGFWKRHFGGQMGMVGKSIELNDEKYAVVGIMPAWLRFPRAVDIWIPMDMSPKALGPRGQHHLLAIGRLKLRVPVAKAQSELQTIAKRLEQQYPDSNKKVGAVVIPLKEQLVGRSRPQLLILLGAVALVLLIACANVANLLLVRATSRQREIAIRSALGAGRGRIVRQMLTESVLLSLLGSVLGLGLAWGCVRALATAESLPIPRQRPIGMDGGVLLFTLATGILVGILFGLVPALQVSHLNLSEELKASAQALLAPSGRRRMVRDILVVGEIAVSLALLVGAGLLLRSFAKLREVNVGIRPEGVLAMNIVLPAKKYSSIEQQTAFFQRLLEGLGNAPGVEAAAVSSELPVEGGSNGYITVEGQDNPALAEILVEWNFITPDYFRALGIPFLRGRNFTEQDFQDTADTVLKIDAMVQSGKTQPPPGLKLVAVINQTMARQFWPHEDPMGRVFKLGGTFPVKVAGIVGDVREWGIRHPVVPQAYFALPLALDTPGTPVNIVIRRAGAPMGALSTVRHEVRSLDSGLALFRVRTIEEIISESTAGTSYQALLLGVFALLALILAAVGIYGVMANAVVQRTHEVGIRVALGAKRSDVLGLVVGQGAKLALAGVAIGLAGALAVTRLMSSLLFGVSAKDPLTFAAVAGLLMAVALVACYIPARRATKVDPMVALRYE
ncbi:MAG: ABC transporter permease [Terriglobia bacterium]|jgi:putative ABC transport system permease protein